MNILAMLGSMLGQEKMQEMEAAAMAAGARMIQAEKDIAEIKRMVSDLHKATFCIGALPPTKPENFFESFDDSEADIHG